MKVIQTTISDRFEWIKCLHFLLASKLITQHDFWLLTGNFVILYELPDVEDCLPKNVKSDLETQRLLAANFMGIASSSKPAMVVGFTRIGVGAIWGEIKGARVAYDEDKNEAAALERRDFLEKEKTNRGLTVEEEEEFEAIKEEFEEGVDVEWKKKKENGQKGEMR